MKWLNLVFPLFVPFYIIGAVAQEDLDLSKEHGPQVFIQIAAGDKLSYFLLESENHKVSLAFRNSSDEKQTISLSQKNYDYIVSQLKELPESTSVSQCPRRRVEIQSNLKDLPNLAHFAVCLSSRSPAAQRTTRLINLLVDLL